MAITDFTQALTDLPVEPEPPAGAEKIPRLLKQAETQTQHLRIDHALAEVGIRRLLIALFKDEVDIKPENIRFTQPIPQYKMIPHASARFGQLPEWSYSIAGCINHHNQIVIYFWKTSETTLSIDEQKVPPVQ